VKKMVKKESGEVMIESTIVIVITLLMLVWILGVGFIYYQKYVVRIATNDLAKKVAVTYDSPDSDIVMGYVSANDVSGKRIYFTSNVTDENEERADSYMNYMMNKANLFGTVKEVNVDVEHIDDATSRSHVKITTECTFDTPFGMFLELFGMPGTTTYRVSAYADSTDIQGHVSTVITTKAFASGAIVKTPGCVKSTIDAINAFIEAKEQLSN